MEYIAEGSEVLKVAKVNTKKQESVVIKTHHTYFKQVKAVVDGTDAVFRLEDWEGNYLPLESIPIRIYGDVDEQNIVLSDGVLSLDIPEGCKVFIQTLLPNAENINLEVVG